MNRRMIIHIIGQIVKLEALMLLAPLVVSLIYRDGDTVALAITVLIALAVGYGMTLLSRTRDASIYAQEGFIIVAGAWIIMSAIGALPFVISGEIPSYIDAFFETVSGFTTTGASILRDVEAMSHGLAFWRSFTHWSGGMGILVLVMAIVPTAGGRSIHIMRAEVPGPQVGKLVPRIRDTAKLLYLIYIAMTVLEIVMLLCGGMPLFESMVHAFGTAGTGGFGVKADSIAGYNAYLQWVIAVFMMLFGVNFNLYYLMIIRRFRSVFKSGELWVYLGIAAASAAVITVNIYPMYETLSETIRTAFFQVSSVMTTTGFATADFNAWPALSKTILFLLMFIGACAGSTGGGLKVSRVMLLFKTIRAELRRMLHPRSVGVVRLEGKVVPERTMDGVKIYFALYMVIFAAAFLFVSLDGFDLETNISAVTACFNNIGPGFAGVGPTANYADYGWFSKLVLSASMLLGRLEIYPLLLAFTPSTWTKK